MADKLYICNAYLIFLNIEIGFLLQYHCFLKEKLLQFNKISLMEEECTLSSFKWEISIKAWSQYLKIYFSFSRS